MNIDILGTIFSGMFLGAVLILWKRLASRWETWFPLLKTGAKWSMYLLFVLAIFFMIGQIQEVNSPNSLALILIGLAIPFVGSKIYYSKLGLKTEKYERGAKVASALDVKLAIKRAKKKTDLQLGGVPLPIDVEPYHFMIAGSTGSGKSVAIATLLDRIKERGDSAIVIDSGGEFLKRYFEPDYDFIINPFDERCVPWSPTAEIKSPWDAEAIAKSIIPNASGESKEWNSYAQTFLSSILTKLFESNKMTLKSLLYYVQEATLEELTVLLKGTPAASQLFSDKTFGSIRTIATNYLAPYNFLEEAEDYLSISEFIQAETGGFLFLTYRDDQMDTLRSMFSCILDVAARTILSLPANSSRRVWLIIDEFASIGAVQSIEAVATKARKVGGCLVIGVQTISQLKDRYGEHMAQTIMSCLSTWLVLRCTDADTAEYMSKYIGEAQITRTSAGTSASEASNSKSWNEQSLTQRVILASEIQKLANLDGFLKLAGQYPVCTVNLKFPPAKPNQTEAYLQKTKIKMITTEKEATPSLMLAPAPMPEISATVEDYVPFVATKKK